jgi:hypothetical protein
MVEAGIVAPVMALFLGLMIYTFNSYDTKMSAQQDTRRAVWSYASHSCRTNGGGIVSANPASWPQDDNPDPGGYATQKNDRGAQAAISRSKAFANATVRATARGPFAWQTFTRRVNNDSHCMCDEIPYEGGFQAMLTWFVWAYQFLARGIP